MVTILDVVDGFFGSTVDLSDVPGRRLYEFGEEIGRFAAAQDTLSPQPDDRTLYLGGWPSANVWLGAGGPLTMASLLYADHVVARDPLTDWFARQRHHVPTLLRSRPGARDPEGTPRVAETRQFLSIVLPALHRYRPLVESGAITLVPSRSFLASNQLAIQRLTDHIVDLVVPDPLMFTRRFAASELAVEDNARGFFVFAGGDRETQIRQAVSRAVEFFAGEYLLSSGHGATYCAPFTFEAHLCEQGLGHGLTASPGDRVVQALLQTDLPLFQGLSPEVVASVRDADEFGEIRRALFNTYRDIPFHLDPPDVVRAIAEAESAVLGPVVARLRKEATGSGLGAVLRSTVGFSFRVGFGAAVGAAIAPGPMARAVAAGAAAEAGLSAVDRVRKRHRVDTGVAWQKLYAHSQTVGTEVRPIDVVDRGKNLDWWGIPEHPSMATHVTPGMLIHDFVPRRSVGERTGGPKKPYLPCSCGSGIKHKFCCKGLK